MIGVENVENMGNIGSIGSTGKHVSTKVNVNQNKVVEPENVSPNIHNKLFKKELISVLCTVCNFPSSLAMNVVDDYMSLFHVGDHLNVFDKEGMLCAAIVTKMRHDGLMEIHYLCWGNKFDECISPYSKRIQSYRRLTNVPTDKLKNGISNKIRQMKEDTMKREQQEQLILFEKARIQAEKEKEEIQGVVNAYLDSIWLYLNAVEILEFPIYLPNVFTPFSKSSQVSRVLNEHLQQMGLTSTMDKQSIQVSLLRS